MKVMVIIRATESSEAGVMPSEELLAAMGTYNEQLVAAGVMQAGEGLKPSSEGVRVRFSGADRTVTDGPFAETKELIAGYWLWEVDSLDHAVEWVRRCPNPTPEDSEIEIRPLFEMADFAESDPTGEHAAAEEQLRETLAAGNSGTDDEQTIRRMMAEWSRAVETKNVDAIVADYTPEAVQYDAIPPYKTVGSEKIRKAWEACLPYFPEVFRSEHRDIVVQVSGDTAFVYGMHHFVPTPPDHPCGTTWMRVTLGCQRIGGSWKVVREHVSIPFNPMDNTAWMIRDPAVLDAPDYSSGMQPPS